MTDELKAGDFVWVRGKEGNPFTYMVVNPVVAGAPPQIGGMTLVARWYRTELLEKVKTDEN